MKSARYLHSWAWLCACAAIAGCAGGASESPDANSADKGLTHRDTEVRHEACALDGAGAEPIDANGDGAADVTIVRAGGREVCRAIDFNFDREIDTWVYLDGGGQVRRRENDYDRDGRIDEVIVYSGGAVVEKQRATTLGGRLDTWHYYQGGRLARTERDSNGDAVVDQWWEYPKPDRPECPVIHADVNGDGKPDPGVSVDVCAERTDYKPPDIESGEQRPFDFEGPAGALPTEVKEQDKGETEQKPPAGGEGSK